MLGVGSVFFWFIDINLFWKFLLETLSLFTFFSKFPNDTSSPQINLLNSKNRDFPRFTFYPTFSQVSSFQHGNSQFFYSPSLRITLRTWDSSSGVVKSIAFHLLFCRLYRLAMKGNVLYMLSLGECNMKII